MSTAREFRDFILRGNVIDLAVAVVIGAAFGAIVSAFVKDLLTPLIGMFGKIDLSYLHLKAFNADFAIGDFLNIVIYFIIVSAVVFFLVVKPVNHLMSLRKTETAVDPTTRECPFCVSSIPIKATKCAFCTADVPAA